MRGLKFRVQDLEFRIEEIGISVRGSVFREWGLECRLGV
jgi:hypothetical protein